MKKSKALIDFKNLFLNNAFLYKFYFLYFFKSLIGPVIPFIFAPLYTIAILYINGPEYSLIALPCLIANPLIFITFWLGSSMIMDIKKNSLVEKYFIFSKNSFLINLVSFFFILVIISLSFFWNLLIIFFISFDTNFFKVNILENVSWGQLFFAFIFASILSVSICILMSSLFKSIISLQIVNYILSMFLLVMSGSIVPLSVIVSNNVSNTISYFSIFRYINAMFVESLNKVNLTGTNIFNLSLPYEMINPKLGLNESGDILINLNNRITIFQNYDQSLNLFISIFGSVGLFIFAMLLNRSKKRK